MKVKELWEVKVNDNIPVLVEEWRVLRFIKDKPVLTVQPNGWGYSNSKLENSFYYIDVWYKFTKEGIRFSYDEKNGYKLLNKYIKFPSEYVPVTGKNVYILEKIGSLNYRFIKANKSFKLKITNS